MKGSAHMRDDLRAMDPHQLGGHRSGLLSTGRHFAAKANRLFRQYGLHSMSTVRAKQAMNNVQARIIEIELLMREREGPEPTAAYVRKFLRALDAEAEASKPRPKTLHASFNPRPKSRVCHASGKASA